MDSSPLDLLHQQMALERKGVDGNGRLYRLPGDNPDDMPRVMTAHLVSGQYGAYLRDDLPRPVAERLASLKPQQVHEDEAAVLAILGEAGGVWRGRTSFFSRPYEPNEYAKAVERAGRFIVEVGEALAAEAWSSRSTDLAAELAVETRPEFQRRGYGRQVCAAWATHQLAAGRIAFYSHSVENMASAALARSLGVEHFMDNVNYG